MSAQLLILIAIIYALVAIERFVRGDDGLALFAMGCTLANLGLALRAL
ncbi:MAG TPA: hypothetical protein VJ797_15635 [Burkholderiales bacterium]|nr:hypothetical protein [Burkholderiales bacterium]